MTIVPSYSMLYNLVVTTVALNNLLLNPAYLIIIIQFSSSSYLS